MHLEAIGGLTLGITTRIARRYTARPLQAGRAEVAAHGLVQPAAMVRVFVPLALPSAYQAAPLGSALLWFAAFRTFVVAYVPILSRPRLEGHSG